VVNFRFLLMQVLGSGGINNEKKHESAFLFIKITHLLFSIFFKTCCFFKAVSEKIVLDEPKNERFDAWFFAVWATAVPKPLFDVLG